MRQSQPQPAWPCLQTCQAKTLARPPLKSVTKT
jgi:hypothetical protein